MGIAALIALRETFEACMILCILLACIQRMERNNLRPALWAGVITGVIMSIILGYGMQFISDVFIITHKDAYEGFVLMTAALLMLWMIVWMASSTREWKKHLERTSASTKTLHRYIGIFLLSFTAIFREGAEIVLFLQASAVMNGNSADILFGIVLGVIGAIGLSFILLQSTRRLPLQVFFIATGVLILLLGTHLVAEGAESFGIFFGFPLEKMAWLSGGAGLLYALTGGTLWWRKHSTYSAAATSTRFSASPPRV